MTNNEKLPQPSAAVDTKMFANQIKQWGRELSFQQIGISDIELSEASAHLQTWLDKQFHGEMDYMARNVEKRAHPDLLVPETLRVISIRMDYKVSAADSEEVMDNPELGFISRYALGRDYHKMLRKRLQKLARRIEEAIGPFGYRVFTDSAPVMERALAQKAGLGWIGKHANLLNRDAGSWFFLGSIYTNLPLPVDEALPDHCGDCRTCIDVCPTKAIVAPYQVDARLCISYLTIELRSSIPVELRPLMGNRIYGCDDCQLVCPWNRFAKLSVESDFEPRHGLDAPSLIELFNWSEAEFLKKTEGSPIRRIGYECWLRNIAVALGNGPKTNAVIKALKEKSDHPSELVREHTLWALEQI